jgi:hypothetical protein
VGFGCYGLYFLLLGVVCKRAHKFLRFVKHFGGVAKSAELKAQRSGFN